MFGSQALEVAIGVFVLFSMMSLFATAAMETIEAWAKRRAKLIHKALEQLFSPNSAGGTSAIKDFYESITISPLYASSYSGPSGSLPSYITPNNFAAAVLEVARKQAGAAGANVHAATAEWLDKLSDPRLAKLIKVAIETVGNDPEKIREYLAGWFDSQMSRVSGWYKRWTQWVLLAIGLGSAVFLNVDALAVAHHLYRNDAVREVIVSRAQPLSASTDGQEMPGAKSPDEIFTELSGYGFPMGWKWSGSALEPVPQCALRTAPGQHCGLSLAEIMLMILGWLITAFAVSLGAPFWFDVLNKFMVIRSTVKSFEKSTPEASEDRQIGRNPGLIKIDLNPSAATPPAVG